MERFVQVDGSICKLDYEGDVYDVLVPSDQDPDQETKIALLVIRLPDGTYSVCPPPKKRWEEPEVFFKQIKHIQKLTGLRIYWSNEPVT